MNSADGSRRSAGSERARSRRREQESAPEALQLDEGGAYGARGEDEIENGVDGAVRDRHQLADRQPSLLCATPNIQSFGHGKMRHRSASK